MARRKNYYHSYRGRGGASRVLRLLVILLLILFLGVLGFYIWAQRYLVYTSNGVRFELPFLQNEEKQEDHSGDENQLLISGQEWVPGQQEEDSEEAEAAPLRAVEVTAADLTSGAAAGLVEEAGGNALLVEMKGKDGKLAYVSAVELAEASGASGTDLGVNQALAALKEEGLYLIARVHCFEDDLLVNYDASLAILTNSGYRWQGPDGLRWVCPADQRVTEYLVELCGELAALGFNEILLDSAGYPSQGNLGYIKVGERYNAQEFSQLIGDFYAQAAQRVAQEGSVLSVAVDEEVAQTGENPLTGQTLEALTEYAAHCWLAVGAEEEAALQTALAESGTAPEDFLVLISAGDEPEDGWNRAVLLTE